MILLEISTHSGDIDEVEVETYDVEDITSQLNDNDIQAVNFGQNIYSRIDLKNIKVIKTE